MRRSIQLATITLLCATSPVAAEELQLGAHFQTSYSDAAVASGGNGDSDDVIFAFGPDLRLSGEHPRLSYQIDQAFGYKLYQKNDQLSDWTYDLRTNGSWQMTPHLSLSVNESFTSQPQLSVVEAAEAGEDQANNLDTSRVLTNTFSAALTATPTARLTTSAEVASLYRHYEDPSTSSQDLSAEDFASTGNQDILSTTVSTHTTYLLTEAHLVGAGFRWTTRDFESNRADAQGTTNVYEVFASWTWQIDARTTFSAQAGPAFSGDELEATPTTFGRYAQVLGDPSQLVNPLSCARPGPPVLFIPPDIFLPTRIVDSSCEGIPQRLLSPAEQDLLASLPFVVPGIEVPEFDPSPSNVNVFFSLSLQRRWDQITAFADWSRSDSQTQGIGSATVLDSFRAGLRYQPSLRWHALLTFRFTRRFTDFDQESVFPFVFEAANALLEIPDVSGSPIIGTIPAGSRFKTTDDLYHLQLRLNRDWGRNSSLYAGVDWFNQDSNTKTRFDTFQSNRQHFRVEVGFNYRFQPIRF